jgi:phospholipid transport system substrate-binding protein
LTCRGLWIGLGFALLAFSTASAAATADEGATPAAAAASATGDETALQRTRETLEETRVIIDSARTHNQKLAALNDLLQGFLDTDTMGRRALDRHWQSFSPGQQAEFLKLFRELFQRTYVQKLLLFDRPDFEYIGEETTQDYVRVDTAIVTPRDEFAVTYQFQKRDGKWMASDIQIEDLSLTTNFRRQLDHLLSKSSVQNVLDRMRRKYGKDEDGDDSGGDF